MHDFLDSPNFLAAAGIPSVDAPKAKGFRGNPSAWFHERGWTLRLVAVYVADHYPHLIPPHPERLWVRLLRVLHGRVNDPALLAAARTVPLRRDYLRSMKQRKGAASA